VETGKSEEVTKETKNTINWVPGMRRWGGIGQIPGGSEKIEREEHKKKDYLG